MTERSCMRSNDYFPSLQLQLASNMPRRSFREVRGEVLSDYRRRGTRATGATISMKLIARARRAVRALLVQLPGIHSISRVVRKRSSYLDGKGQLFRDEEQVCAQSGLFDREWYLHHNLDVAASGIEPIAHYIRAGAAEGRDPHPLFDSDWYLDRNPDVAAAGINPLTHYVTKGAAEGRDPHPLFDSNWYLQRNPDIASSGA